MRRGPPLPAALFWQTRQPGGHGTARSAAIRGMGAYQRSWRTWTGERATPLATAWIHDRLVLVPQVASVLEQGPGMSPDRRAQTRAGKPTTAPARSATSWPVAFALSRARPTVFAIGWRIPAEIGGRSSTWLVLVAAFSPRVEAFTAWSREHRPAASPAVAFSSSSSAALCLSENCASPASSLALTRTRPCCCRIASPERIGFTQPASSEERALQRSRTASMPRLWPLIFAPGRRLLGSAAAPKACSDWPDTPFPPLSQPHEIRAPLCSGRSRPKAGCWQRSHFRQRRPAPTLAQRRWPGSLPPYPLERMPCRSGPGWEGVPLVKHADQLLGPAVPHPSPFQNRRAWWAGRLGYSTPSL